MLTDPPGVPGYHLTEALSKRHPKGASVASLRPFTFDRNDRSYLIGLSVHFRRNTHSAPSAAGALLGGAPWARDNGSSVGRRHVRAGRAEPRSALYMAALTAIRRNRHLAAFYKRLRDRGKQPKLALVAVVRKLVAPADALLRANRLWQASAPCAQVPA